MQDLGSTLEAYGALRSQVVDLSAEGPRSVRYLDLTRAAGTSRVAVVESQGQPCVYVVDGRGGEVDREATKTWVRRVAFRGDAEWVGVLRPGKLDVYRASLREAAELVPWSGTTDPPTLFPSLERAQDDGKRPSVRRAVLDLLRQSLRQAAAFVSQKDALSLVGRALFWRFLVDRELLTGLDPGEVSKGATSWEACLATKRSALQTFEWLDETFNGGLLPIEQRSSALPEAVFGGPVANIAHGATPTGQLPLKLPTAWREIHFADVPVGLLSEVYEAFAHDADPKSARDQSIHYTPRAIAELVVDEALSSLEDEPRPRLLDPACGAGVFLVASFRALVAREWQRSGARPTRAIVRRILTTQLVGFDVNAAALRLAELALYLTAIDLDPSSRPRPLTLLKFSPLRDTTLVLKQGGARDGSLEPMDEHERERFDAVIGNPPWTAAKGGGAKRRWEARARPFIAGRLGAERGEAFGFADGNPDLAFLLKALEWAKPGGCVALITHGRWLFHQTAVARRLRADVLESAHVTGILNGARLRDASVWPGVRAAFAIVFARNEMPPADARFVFITPELDEHPDRRQTRLRIDWKDSIEVQVGALLAQPWLLKARTRATVIDEQVIAAVADRGMPLAAYLERLGTKLCNGYQTGGTKGTQKSAAHLHGLPDLRGAVLTYVLAAPTVARLPKVSAATLLFPRARENYRAPLLIVHESITVGERARASVGLVDVAYDERFSGASLAGVREGEEVARYLQLVLQSSLTRHALLLLDGQLGIERDLVHKESIEAIPVRPWDSLSRREQRAALALSRKLEEAEDPMPAALARSLDEFVFDLFDLSDVHRDAVRDTLATAMPTADAKKAAVRPTSPAERISFAETCEATLADVLRASGLRARVRVRDDAMFARWALLQVDVFDGAPPPRVEPVPCRGLLESADGASASLVTLRVDPQTRIVALWDAYRHWTPTRARLLASTLLAE